MPFQIQLSCFNERCALEKALQESILVGSLDGYFFPSKQLPALGQTSSCCTLYYCIHWQNVLLVIKLLPSIFNITKFIPTSAASLPLVLKIEITLKDFFLSIFLFLKLWHFLSLLFCQKVAGLIRSAEMISCEYCQTELLSFLSFFKSNWDEASKSSMRIDHYSGIIRYNYLYR